MTPVKPILMSPTMMEELASLHRIGDSDTRWEWGEPDDKGFYTPRLISSLNETAYQDRLDGAAIRLLKEAWPDDWVKVAVDLTFEPGHVALAVWPLDNHPRSGIPMRRARTLAEAADAVREALG